MQLLNQTTRFPFVGVYHKPDDIFHAIIKSVFWRISFKEMLGILNEIIWRGLMIIWRNHNDLKIGGHSTEEIEIILLPIIAFSYILLR